MYFVHFKHRYHFKGKLFKAVSNNMLLQRELKYKFKRDNKLYIAVPNFSFTGGKTTNVYKLQSSKFQWTSK